MNHYVLDGHEPQLEPDWIEWALWFDTADRRVAHTTMLDGSTVSTVFLGLDHRFSGKGLPVLFETCVFFHEDTVAPSPSPFRSERTLRTSEIQARYSTWAEAEAGHAAIVESLTPRLAQITAHKSTKT